LQEIISDIAIYIWSNPVLSLVIAFIAGFLATRIVAAERRHTEYLDSLLELRIIADMIAAFIGAFVIAGIIHFIRPT